MLFIDDCKSKIFKFNAFLDQGMCADDDI